MTVAIFRKNLFELCDLKNKIKHKYLAYEIQNIYKGIFNRYTFNNNLTLKMKGNHIIYFLQTFVIFATTAISD